MHPPYSLAQLLAPISTEEFFAEYHENQVLHISRNNPDLFSPLMSIKDLDTYLTTQKDSQKDGFKIVPEHKTGDEIYFVSGANTSVQGFYAAYNADSTLVFNGIHRGWPAFAKLASKLGQELSAKVQVNVYLTPQGPAQGPDIHQDYYDILVLQLEGTKHWNFYEPWFDLPLKINNISINANNYWE